MSTGIVNDLATFVTGTSYADLSEDVRHACKRALIDYIAVATLGSVQDKTKILAEYLSTFESKKECSIIGTSLRMDCANSAFLNGSSAHSLDFDDGHRRGSVHIEAVVLPAVLAVAEKYHASAEKIIAAIAVGYDVMARISMAIHPYALNRGFHNTPVAGVFGATAAAASLLELDKAAVIDAFGLAGSFSGGLYAYMQNGADTKRLHPGKAARDGIICAELAKRGYKGPTDIFEGPYNFFEAIPGDFDGNVLTDGLGTEYQVCRIYQKPYASCRHLHGPIDCVRKIKEQHPDICSIEDIKAIRIGTYGVAMKHAAKNYNNMLEIQMSIPCAVSIAMVDDRVTVDSFSPERFSADSQEVKLLEKITVEVDEQCQSVYPNARPAKLWIEKNDGTVYFAELENPRGGAEDPLSDSELENKLIYNCSSIIGSERCRALLNLIWKLEKLSEEELHQLFCVK